MHALMDRMERWGGVVAVGSSGCSKCSGHSLTGQTPYIGFRSASFGARKNIFSDESKVEVPNDFWIIVCYVSD